MKKQVSSVKNIKDKSREFDIKKVLKTNSDCLLGFEGAYKKMEKLNVLVDDINQADFVVYSNFETCDRVSIPVKYREIFERFNHIFSLPVVEANHDNNAIERQKVREEKAKQFVRTFSSNR